MRGGASLDVGNGERRDGGQKNCNEHEIHLPVQDLLPQPIPSVPSAGDARCPTLSLAAELLSNHNFLAADAKLMETTQWS